MTIESDNAKEEIREIVEKCVRCGLCKSLCPVFKIMKEEHYSPRGKAITLDNEGYEKTIYACTLCKACEKKCPVNLKLCTAFVKARGVLVENKKEPEEARKIIENLDKSRNVYGIRPDKEEARGAEVK